MVLIGALVNETNKQKELTCERLIKYDQQLRLINGALVDEFKQEELALPTTQTSVKLSRHGTSKLDGLGGSLTLVDVPKRQLGSIKVWDLGNCHVRTNLQGSNDSVVS